MQIFIRCITCSIRLHETGGISHLCVKRNKDLEIKSIHFTMHRKWLRERKAVSQKGCKKGTNKKNLPSNQILWLVDSRPFWERPFWDDTIAIKSHAKVIKKERIWLAELKLHATCLINYQRVKCRFLLVQLDRYKTTITLMHITWFSRRINYNTPCKYKIILT